MKHYALLIVATAAACSGATSTSTSSTLSKSAKRGIAYDLASPADLAALSPGMSWWYNWSPYPNTAVPANYATQYRMQFEPMLWTFNGTVSGMQTNGYILVLNEPNIVTQANVTPQQAAQMWPQFEALASQTGANIVGPAMTWGTMTGYEDPVAWLDAFYAAYEAANNGRHRMVATCESRSDVFRYAWFTGRLRPDTHYTSLLGATGQLTDLGKLYLSLPVQ